MLIPVGSGAPHFCGDTVPRAGGVVIVDLSSLKTITRIDTVNRIAMIETGVAFGELIPRLKETGLRLNMPLLPRAGSLHLCLKYKISAASPIKVTDKNIFPIYPVNWRVAE